MASNKNTSDDAQIKIPSLYKGKERDMKHTVERADRPWRTTASIQQVIGNKNKKKERISLSMGLHLWDQAVRLDRKRDC